MNRLPETVLTKKERALRLLPVGLWCLALAALFIGLCSRSSPLYPFNDWDDNNCFFTVGKAMFNGRVVYRDIYEQKGVLLYFLYGLAYLISHTSFLGAYLLEVLCFGAFLFLVWRTGRLFVSDLAVCLILPALSAVICSCYSFYLGGCAEQLCLALLYLPLHCHIRAARETPGELLPPPRSVFLLGLSAGCLLWIKFTMLGIYVGYVLFIAGYLAFRRDWARLLRAAGLFLLGVLAASLPWLIYFAVNGALKDLFTAYFYNNLFLYRPSEKSRLWETAVNIKNGIRWNLQVSLPIAVGFLAAVLAEKDRPFRAGLLCLYVCGTVLPFAGGVAHDYYAMVFAPLAAPGFLFLAWLGQRLWEKRPLGQGLSLRGRAAAAVLLCAVMAAGCGLFAHLRSPNTPYMSAKKEDMWYTRFADTVNAAGDRSLLTYGTLDVGLYTLTDTLPVTKFYCSFNVDLPEMHEELDNAVRTKKTAFIVSALWTRDPAPAEAVLEAFPLVAEYYDLIDCETGLTSIDGDYINYYLFQRKP